MSEYFKIFFKIHSKFDGEMVRALRAGHLIKLFEMSYLCKEDEIIDKNSSFIINIFTTDYNYL
jgi:hypothetical protein